MQALFYDQIVATQKQARDPEMTAIESQLLDPQRASGSEIRTPYVVHDGVLGVLDRACLLLVWTEQVSKFEVMVPMSSQAVSITALEVAADVFVNNVF